MYEAVGLGGWSNEGVDFVSVEVVPIALVVWVRNCEELA